MNLNIKEITSELATRNENHMKRPSNGTNVTL